MKVLEETSSYVKFLDYFEGLPMRFTLNKISGEISINSDDAAKVMGYKDTVDMLSDDRVMDSAIEIQKEIGRFPISENPF